MSAAARYQILAGVVSIVLLASAIHGAQQIGSLSGPVLGYVFDRDAGKLRPVKGILGSATVGAPIDAGFAVSQVLTLDARHVIASTDASPDVVTLNLDDSQTSPMAISEVSANPSRASASLGGTSAAFYYAGAQQVRIVTGLPREPHGAGLLTIERALTQLAINDDGTLVVYAVQEGDGEALYGWTAATGNARFLTSAVSVSGLVLTRSGDAIVTDRGANEVFAIWDAGGGAIRQPLADATDGVSDPTGVAISSANRIYVANAGSATTMVLDSNGRYLKTHQCSCTISGVYPLRDSVFRLTDGIDRTIFVLDASSAEERILFVPPPQE
jgi:DNA-binding beta-propeller fold protein YncE